MTDNHEPDIADISRAIARKLMYQAAGKSSQVIDSFVSWLFAGVGACMALVLSNMDGLSSYLSLSSIRAACILFLFGAIFAIIEKFISAFVVGNAEASEKSAEYMARFAETFDDIDMKIVRNEFKEVTLPLTKIAKKIIQGVLRTTHPAHDSAKLCQIQYHFSAFAIFFLLSSMMSLVYGLQV